MLPPFKVSASDWLPFDWSTSGAGNSKWLIMFDHFVIWHQDNSRHPLLVLFACFTVSHYVSLLLKHLFFFDMNAFDRTARDDRQGSSWVVWVRPALALIDTVQSEQAADVIGARVYRMSHGSSESIAYHALWLDRTNRSIPKKEIEKGDRRRATTVHSLAFPILSHPYVILMSWPCGRLSMTQLSYHVYHAFPEVFLTLV